MSWGDACNPMGLYIAAHASRVAQDKSAAQSLHFLAIQFGLYFIVNFKTKESLAPLHQFLNILLCSATVVFPNIIPFH